jgi:hypothetical protein
MNGSSFSASQPVLIDLNNDSDVSPSVKTIGGHT